MDCTGGACKVLQLTFFFFFMWTSFEVFIGFVTRLLLCFMFWFFGPEGCGILAPKPGIEPSLPTLEGKVSTTGPKGKSLQPLDHQGSPSSLLKRSMMWSYII